MAVQWIRMVAWRDPQRQLWLFEQRKADGTYELTYRAIVFHPTGEVTKDFSTIDEGRAWLMAD